MTGLNQLTALRCFLAATRGVSLRDASRATGLTIKEVLRRLESISLCGVPPYSPNDYISYRLLGAGEDAVIDIQYAQHFARPLNFTMQETLALKYALDHFAAAADTESASLAGGLRDVLANALQGKAREVLAQNPHGFVVPRQTEHMRRLMSILAEAVDGRWITELEYYSSHRAKLGRRQVPR
jgi:predicted DNA-binding transcriptional regulator YafY